MLVTILVWQNKNYREQPQLLKKLEKENPNDPNTEDDPIMEAFPKNTESCTKYGKKCDFFDYCTSWHNPLREAHEPPVDLHVQHWDPRNMDHVRETIKL